MNVYYKYVILGIALLIEFGYLLPFLFSDASYELPITGVILLIVTPVAIKKYLNWR